MPEPSPAGVVTSTTDGVTVFAICVKSVCRPEVVEAVVVELLDEHAESRATPVPTATTNGTRLMSLMCGACLASGCDVAVHPDVHVIVRLDERGRNSVSHDRLPA